MARAIGPLKSRGLMVVMSKLCQYICEKDRVRKWEGDIRTAAELAGTIFPDEVMTHPLGMPGMEVTP